MVATRRRFNPNLQKVRISVNGDAPPRVRVHALPEGLQGHEGPLAAKPTGNTAAGGVQTPRARREPGPLPARGRRGSRGAREPPPGGQRPQCVPGRRRRHGRQHGADHARRARRAEPHERPAARRHRPRRDRGRGGPRRAARRPRQQRRDPLPDRARRGRGAGQPPRRARGPGARVRRVRTRRRRRLRLGARPRGGHDAHRRARDGPPRGARPRAHGHAAARPGRRRSSEQDELLAAGARERARGRQGGGGARTRPARRAPRGRRGRRGRLRADRDRGRLPRGAARRAPRPSWSTTSPRRPSTAPSTSPRASATAPTSRSPASGLDAGSFVARLEAMGDSVLVVGDERTLRVHVHTDEPERAVAIFDGAGEVSRFDVADMHEQVAERTRAAGASARPGRRGHLHGGRGGQRPGRRGASTRSSACSSSTAARR